MILNAVKGDTVIKLSSLFPVISNEIGIIICSNIMHEFFKATKKFYENEFEKY